MTRPPLTDKDVVRLIDAWHGITPPNAAALDFARDLPRVIAAFEALPAADFADEPADFQRMLEAFSDQSST